MTPPVFSIVETHCIVALWGEVHTGVAA